VSVERLAGQIRATEEGALPAGEHLMTLDNVAVMSRKKGGWGLRLTSRHESGQYAIEWRNLSSDAEDPYKLTDGQRKGMREFAARFNITTTGKPEEIVECLQEAVGAPVQVLIKQTPHSRIVKHSAPQGIRLRTDAGALTVAGEVVEPDDAYEMEKRLKAALRLTRRSLLAVAEECHNISRGHAYEALGYETLAEFLAQPDVGMSRSEFFTAAKIHEVFVLEHGIEPDRLAEAGMAKLAVVLPKVTAGEIEAETAVADASTNGLRDLRDEYREQRESPVDQTRGCPRCGCIPDEVLDPLRIKWEAA
jgi:hypothetical protein